MCPSGTVRLSASPFGWCRASPALRSGPGSLPLAARSAAIASSRATPRSPVSPRTWPDSPISPPCREGILSASSHLATRTHEGNGVRVESRTDNARSMGHGPATEARGATGHDTRGVGPQHGAAALALQGATGETIGRSGAWTATNSEARFASSNSTLGQSLASSAAA